jgi:DNA-binding LacI/PurR family transcriptional regulator
MRRITMDAIAKLAGVSKGTVSKALNGETGVSVLNW